METGKMLYEGKAKRMFETANPEVLLIEYKNSLTAFNAQKKAEMEGKGRYNTLISAWLFGYLAEKGIPSHFMELVDDNHQLVKKVRILPIEVVVRNITTGTLCKRLGVAEGIKLPRPLIEFYLKDDSLGDPLITEDHALLFDWATQDEIDAMKEKSLAVNEVLRDLFIGKGIVLVDFKLEFGRDSNGKVLLADEISPDTCRFWDSETGKRLDKDRFRKDLGDVLGAYREIWKRLSGKEE
ncbi:MAG: phosphoribosylaminoimidazolesuccinocarboxamide synthase [Synergistales bacterium]